MEEKKDKDGAAKPADAAVPTPPAAGGGEAEDINSLEQLSEGKDKEPTGGATEITEPTNTPPPKKKGIKRILGFFNVYLLIFILLLLIFITLLLLLLLLKHRLCICKVVTGIVVLRIQFQCIFICINAFRKFF